MYEYRRMTSEQRNAVVQARRARGYPLHKPPHLALGEHRHHFAAPAELNALERRLLDALVEVAAPCAGWVVMPNHYHLPVQVGVMSTLGKALGRVHGRSARYVNLRDAARGRQVWYKYTDRKVRSERHFWTCLCYVLFNPVKHGFAGRPDDWPWSCFHELLAERGREWIEDLRRDYPLRDFGQGWDD